MPVHLGLPVTVADPAGGMCVSVQLDRWDAEHRDAQVARLLALGVRTIRQDLRWDYVQPARDTWDWTTEDAVIGAAVDGGIDVIAMVAYGTTWAGQGTFSPPDDPADFAAFAGAAAARYADRVDRYEIWNEPNSGFRFWQVGDPPAIQGDAEGYADLFVPAAAAIHAADPGAEVQFGSVFFHDQIIPGGPEFLADAIAHRPEILADADAVSFHPYPQYPPVAPPEADSNGELPVPDMVAAIEAAAPGLPVVVTEFGWPVFGAVSAEQQAAYTARTVALLHASGVRDTCVYTLEDHPGGIGNPEDAFGLVAYGPGDDKASGVAVAALTAALAGADAHGDAATALEWPDGAHAARYVRGETAITLVWSTAAEMDVVLPNVEGAACASVDGLAVDAGRDGLSVRATALPRIVVQEPCG